MSSQLDGIVQIMSISSDSIPGDMPTETQTLKETLRFSERTVGYSRFYEAKQSGSTVNRLIRCQRRLSVTTHDRAVINDVTYKITLIQYQKMCARLQWI
jgi:hypothetical protein